MILSRRVALNNIQLDQRNDAIVIRKVDIRAPEKTINAVSRMGGLGQRVTGEHFEKVEIRVSYAIRLPKTSLSARRQVFDAVNSWAKTKGWLTTSQVQGKRIYIDQVLFPDGGDMRDWTDEYTIIFRAYNMPFWQETTPSSNACSFGGAASADVSIVVSGNMPNVIDVEFKNTSGSTINTFSASVNGNTISLSELGLANNETLVIDHGTDGLLRIMIGSRSVYNKRSANSADDLFVDPGTMPTVTITTGGAGSATVKCYGRYA